MMSFMMLGAQISKRKLLKNYGKLKNLLNLKI
jgi:hypothetical protein